MKTIYKLMYILCGVILTSSTYAKDINSIKAEADSAFTHEKYEKAINLYNQLASQTASPSVYYNLGCAYYRVDSMAKSVLWLERAALQEPGDEDIRYNLNMAREKTIDKIIPQHEFIMVTFFRQVVNMMNLRGWSTTCILAFLLSLVSFALFFFSNKIILRKVFFFSAILFTCMTVFFNVCGYQQRSFNSNHNHAIIMSPAITVKSTPAESGNDLFVIHEGTNVEILDNSLKNWCEIKIADGKLGWIPANSFEVI